MYHILSTESFGFRTPGTRIRSFLMDDSGEHLQLRHRRIRKRQHQDAAQDRSEVRDSRFEVSTQKRWLMSNFGRWNG